MKPLFVLVAYQWNFWNRNRLFAQFSTPIRCFLMSFLSVANEKINVYEYWLVGIGASLLSFDSPNK